jgi:hypothetical protein
MACAFPADDSPNDDNKEEENEKEMEEIRADIRKLMIAKGMSAVYKSVLNERKRSSEDS